MPLLPCNVSMEVICGGYSTYIAFLYQKDKYLDAKDLELASTPNLI